MSSTKCKNCKESISPTAKFCPYCGVATEQLVTNSQPVHNDTNQGEKYEIALIGLITSFFVPIVGLILGIMALNANKGKQNNAKTMAIIATVVSAVEMALVVIIFIIYFFVFFMTFALY